MRAGGPSAGAVVLTSLASACPADADRLSSSLVVHFVGIRRLGRANGVDVGLDVAGRLHLLDFGAHVVERLVDGVEALLREVREIGFGGRARDVELGGQRAHGVERAARVANDLFLLLGGRLERQRLVVGLAHVLAQILERADVVVHQRAGLRPRPRAAARADRASA